MLVAVSAVQLACIPLIPKRPPPRLAAADGSVSKNGLCFVLLFASPPSALRGAREELPLKSDTIASQVRDRCETLFGQSGTLHERKHTLTLIVRFMCFLLEFLVEFIAETRMQESQKIK